MGLDLKYEYSDNGYCRVVFSAINSEGEKFKYCLQNEAPNGIAFVLYSCTSDDEPSYPIDLAHVDSLEIIKGGSDIDEELVLFAAEKGLKTIELSIKN